MDLFAASGIDLGDGGRGGRPGRSAIGRTLRVPLLNHKVVAEAQKKFTFDFTPRQIESAASYAKKAASTKFAKQKETAVRNLFCEKILGDLLGYTQSTRNAPTRWPSSAPSGAEQSMSRLAVSAFLKAQRK